MNGSAFVLINIYKHNKFMEIKFIGRERNVENERNDTKLWYVIFFELKWKYKKVAGKLYFRGLGFSITKSLRGWSHVEVTANHDDEVWILHLASLHNKLR